MNVDGQYRSAAAVRLCRPPGPPRSHLPLLPPRSLCPLLLLLLLLLLLRCRLLLLLPLLLPPPPHLHSVALLLDDLGRHPVGAALEGASEGHLQRGREASMGERGGREQGRERAGSRRGRRGCVPGPNEKLPSSSESPPSRGSPHRPTPVTLPARTCAPRNIHTAHPHTCWRPPARTCPRPPAPAPSAVWPCQSPPA